MIPSDTIAKLISAPLTAGTRGRLMYLANEQRRHFNQSTPAQRRFVEDFSLVNPPERHAYAHPADGALRETNRPEGALTPAEIAWLQQLPSNPAEVSYDDAVALAKLDLAVPPMKYPADNRLVRASWTPVRRWHDRNAARFALINAEQPLSPLPASVLGALSDAIAAENDQLRPDEADVRASNMIERATARRQAARDDAIRIATDKLAEIDQLEQQRVSAIAS